jgi:hypothetical protein
MSQNWGYVAAGYVLTTVTLVTYFVWIRVRTRRLRRTLADDRD